MRERLTREREEEIRARLEIGRLPVLGTALDVAELLAELDAMRAAPPTTYLHADGTEEPIGELVARLTRERDAHAARNRGATQAIVDAIGSVGPESVEDAAQRIVERLRTAAAEIARVRELEAGRDMARAEVEMLRGVGCSEDGDGPCGACLKCARQRADKAEANLAETRAQLARLREAAERYVAIDRADEVERGTADIPAEPGSPRAEIEACLSTPGPTLAEMRAEALRDAARRWMADHENSTSAEHVHDWLRQRADDLEAGR